MSAPLPAEPGADALAAAQANADAIARQLTTSDLTHDGRADLAYDLREALGQIDAIERRHS